MDGDDYMLVEAGHGSKAGVRGCHAHNHGKTVSLAPSEDPIVRLWGPGGLARAFGNWTH
jgi:hypothetical protein